MKSEIGNRSLLHKLGDFLQIIDQKISPSHLDVDDIKAVVSIADLSRATPTAGRMMYLDQGTISIAAAASNTLRLIMPGGAIYPTLDYGYAYRICTLFTQITLNAAGAIALNGKQIRWRPFFSQALGDPGTDIPICEFSYQAFTGQLTYNFALRGYCQAAVQEGVSTWEGALAYNSGLTDGSTDSNFGLQLLVEVEDGTVFPALSTIRNTMSAWQSSNQIVPSP